MRRLTSVYLSIHRGFLGLENPAVLTLSRRRETLDSKILDGDGVSPGLREPVSPPPLARPAAFRFGSGRELNSHWASMRQHDAELDVHHRFVASAPFTRRPPWR